MKKSEKYWINNTYAKLVMIVLGLYVVFVSIFVPIVLHGEITFIIWFNLLMYIVLTAAGIPYVMKGYLDKLSFNKNGFTVHRLWKSSFYSWDLVYKISKVNPFSVYHFNKQCYRIYLRCDSGDLKEVHFYEDENILYNLKLYKEHTSINND